MKDPELVLHWRSYVAESSSLAALLIGQVSQESGTGTTRPDALIVNEIEGAPDDLALVPTLNKSSAHLPVTWVQDGAKARINLKKLLMVRRFPIPKGTRVHIPISAESLEGVGPTIAVHFGQAQFEPIERSKRLNRRDTAVPVAAPGSDPDPA